MVLDGGFRVINEAILRSGPDVDLVASCSKQGQGAVTVEGISRVTLDGGDSPQGQGATVDGLHGGMMRRIGGGGRRSMGSVKPSAALPRRMPRGIRHWVGGSRAEPVIDEAVDMGVRVHREVVHHSGLKVGSFGVLALSFVGVLVAA